MKKRYRMGISVKILPFTLLLIISAFYVFPADDIGEAGEIYGDLLGQARETSLLLGRSIRSRFSGFSRNSNGFNGLSVNERDRYLPLWVSGRFFFRRNNEYQDREGEGWKYAAADSYGFDAEAGMETGIGGRFLVGAALQGGMPILKITAQDSQKELAAFGGGLYGSVFIPAGPGDLILGFGAAYTFTSGHISREDGAALEAGYTVHGIQGLFDAGWDCRLTDLFNVQPYIGAVGLALIDHYWMPGTAAGGRSVLRLGRQSQFDIDINWQHFFDPSGGYGIRGAPEGTDTMETLGVKAAYGFYFTPRTLLKASYELRKASYLRLGRVSIDGGISHGAELFFENLF